MFIYIVYDIFKDISRKVRRKNIFSITSGPSYLSINLDFIQESYMISLVSDKNRNKKSRRNYI